MKLVGLSRKTRCTYVSVGSGAAQRASYEAHPCAVAFLGRSVTTEDAVVLESTPTCTNHCPRWCKHDPSVHGGGRPRERNGARTSVGSGALNAHRSTPMCRSVAVALGDYWGCRRIHTHVHRSLPSVVQTRPICSWGGRGLRVKKRGVVRRWGLGRLNAHRSKPMCCSVAEAGAG